MQEIVREFEGTKKSNNETQLNKGNYGKEVERLERKVAMLEKELELERGKAEEVIRCGKSTGEYIQNIQKLEQDF